ncbi:MAG: hypothetical protein LDLANPLL_01774 [Turneriella sp.]|nr:hypothetical protein [Turneriella sp.]
MEKGGATEATYLDLVYAREKAQKLKDMNMRDIQVLQNLANTFPEALDKGTFEKISNEYKEGLKLVYRMDYVAAEKTLRANRENIYSALEKASGVFRTKTGALLNECADRMADIEMQAENAATAETVRLMGIVEENQHRLSVGYQQLNSAARAERQRRYPEALSYYRLSRLHAIHLKIALAKDDNEKKALREKYMYELGEKKPANTPAPSEKPSKGGP